MRELSLFSGAGGGLLGTHLLGWTPIGYVEYDDYCQRVIRQRILDGILPNAPIFGDVRAFISEGYAASYQGLVDVITGGFPCQPFSNAGKRLGVDDERNMWPATVECIRIIRPRYALLENVPGILSSGYFGTILGDLAESGYDARWRILSAAEMGAPHKRDRLWIVAYPNRSRRTQSNDIQSNHDGQWNHTPPKQSGWAESRVTECGRCDVADTNSANGKTWLADTMGNRKQNRHGRYSRPLAFNSGWEAEPNVGRVVDGLASRMDRLKAIGNGQVPSVAAAAWHLLTEGI